MNPFIEARNAALSPIPVKKGTKIPAISWKAFQEHICSEMQAAQWGNGGGFSIGLVTGDVSGRLMCLDFEAGFMGRIVELRARLDEAGVLDVFESWFAGYRESTPRGGFHVLVRLEGEGECPRNDVFAADPDGHPLIETRGEGGYVLVAPSPGYQWAKGCSYDTIVYCTLEEWAIVEAVLRSFDTPTITAPAPTVPARSTAGLDPMLRDSWIDEVKADLPSIPDLLLPRGWQWTGTSDDFGKHLTRPGKDPREGASASLSHDGYLHVHSTNAGLPVGVSLDAADILICWQTGQRDAPSQQQRTDYFRGFLQAQPPASAEGTGAGAAPAENGVAAPQVTPPCIDDWFWEERALLRQIRDASMERGLSPDGVFGTWLSDYATTIPMGIWVAGPPRHAPLNMFSVLVGSSGTSKSASMGVAAELLGWNVNTNPHVLLGRSLRSGEGLCRLAVIPRKRGDDDDPAYQNAIQIVFDEGGVLGKQADRQGSTTIPYLNTAWSGQGVVGGALAREVFEFPANLVRVCAVMGVQYGAAANLFEGESARLGFPQRLVYFGLRRPGLADADVDAWSSEPATPLDLPWWDHAKHSGKPIGLKFPADIEHDVREWTNNKNHGTGIDDDLDAHQMNLTKRVAAILCLADTRTTPTDRDWALATHVIDISRNIRRSLLASLRGLTMERTRARINEAVQTADALDNRWIRTRAARIARHVHTQPDGCTLKDIKNRLASDEKKRVHEMLAYAAAADWVIHNDDRFSPGGSKPAL